MRIEAPTTMVGHRCFFFFCYYPRYAATEAVARIYTQSALRALVDVYKIIL